ncbi:MAG: NDP-hexose 2,3-dehydratase family protein [Pseudomonadota bacterium]|nr:NDP-hexose 2,3-dehydratase family protein [Pseudomonadota bacterium]
MNGIATPRSDVAQSFLRSASARVNRFHDFADTQRWLRDLRANCDCSVVRVPFSELDQWYFDEQSGDLKHRSGRFFSIAGLHCTPAWDAAASWEQPIILQPEIGILGILTREFDGLRYFLMQAKMEPGNVNLVQLSPTMQATFSNYSQAHNGKLPPYTQYFLDPNARVINSQLQSETGTRFFRKFNRNVLLDVVDDVAVLPGFRWFTLYEIQQLMAEDDAVNMDSRSVLSNVVLPVTSAGDDRATVFLRSATSGFDAHAALDDLRAWLQAMRDTRAIDTRHMPLNAVRDWVRDDWSIHHATRNYFEVAGVRVEGGAREVASWCQPLLKHDGLGLSGFLCTEIGGVLHFLMQAKPEPGIVGSVELGPTVSLFDYRRRAEQGTQAPYLEHFLQAPASAILHASIQSEEGGRFWNLRNHVLVVQVPDAHAIERHDNFAWMTLAQLRELAQGESCVNSEARTLLSCLPLYI